MSIEETPLPERVATYYEELSSVAADLNVVSDELGKSITEIDGALKHLNLGISTWLMVSDWEEPNGSSFWSHEMGYARIAGKWGICLRRTEGDLNYPDGAKEEEWAFNDAPRALRLGAIGKIPNLLDKLSKEAANTTKELKARLGEAKTVAEEVKDAANRLKKGTAKSPQSRTDAQIAVGLDLEQACRGVVAALRSVGHLSAADLLAKASWSINGAVITIQVPEIGRKMLALTINAAAEKIIREQFQKLGLPSRFLIMPSEPPQTGSEVK